MNTEPVWASENRGFIRPVPLDQCQAFASANPLKAAWNLDFSRERYGNVRRMIHLRLRCSPKGKGNKAWKRADRLEREWRASGGFYVTDFIPN